MKYKFLLVISVLSLSFILGACSGTEETKEPVNKPTEEVNEKAEEPSDTEKQISEQQQKTIDSLNNFPEFINNYKELGEEKTPTWDNYLYGQEVTWSGTIMEIGSSQIWVLGAGDYTGQTWDDVNTSGNEAYNVFVADFTSNLLTDLKPGDSVTVKGTLESRGDFDLNYHWKIYNSEIQ
ncbi:hypothetical protein [Cytobacillus oceanisediminis]|uniref:hypothetical protein n=1 Tax=Cytobacillus oceanisediminis TaxID=665099 RepID=UPI001C23DC71|nr:hypothetical protein [Cytobacillus oceanisediminis]MBU8768275.1 hypothetical protein [Cytobacillus oceanisediminis]